MSNNFPSLCPLTSRRSQHLSEMKEELNKTPKICYSHGTAFRKLEKGWAGARWQNLARTRYHKDFINSINYSIIQISKGWGFANDQGGGWGEGVGKLLFRNFGSRFGSKLPEKSSRQSSDSFSAPPGTNLASPAGQSFSPPPPVPSEPTPKDTPGPPSGPLPRPHSEIEEAPLPPPVLSSS